MHGLVIGQKLNWINTYTVLMYSPRMRHSTLFIFAIACVSLFAVQVSGLHLHAEAGGHDEAGSHKPHLQQAFSHDADHGGAHVDVVVFEPAPGSFEADVIVPNSAVAAFLTLAPVECRWTIPESKKALGRYVRWRPPARAPPFPA
jgi:hypothetical protein